MALTKVTGGTISTTSDYQINNLVGVAGTFTGNLNVEGVLTYEDVTNIDAVGLITARKGIHLGAGATVGHLSTVGVSTITSLTVNGVLTAGHRIDMTQGYQLGWKDGSTNRARIHGDSGSNFIVETGSSNTERFRIATDGDLTHTGSDNVEYKMKCGSSSGNNIIAFLNSSGVTRGNITYDSDNNFLFFNVNQAERARIDSAGNFLFNTTSGGSSSNPGLKLYPWASGGDDWGAWMAHVIGCPTGTNTPYYLYNTNSTNNGHRFSIKVNGGINNHSGNNTNLSDRREKKDIEDLPSTWEAIKQWRLRKFHFKDVPEDATEYDKNYGVIAQEIEEISPEVGRDWEKQQEKKDDDGNIIQEQVMRRSVREQKIMWMAIKALQEAMTEIETLKAKVAALEST